jgi:hypothetical protein
MSDPNWTSPSGPEAPVPQTPMAYGQQQPSPSQGADPRQNWGLAVPGANYYAVLVPRPPRPANVGMAIMLAYAGVGLALVFQTANSIYQWTNRERLFGPVYSNPPPGVDVKDVVDTSTMFGLVLGGLLWLLVAVGVVVCTVLTARKKNAARIVLAVAMGVLGLYNLCGVAAASFLRVIGEHMAQQSSQAQVNFSLAAAGVTWWAVTAQALLGVVAIIVFVLLVVPSANRYFVAGAGRRFVPDA